MDPIMIPSFGCTAGKAGYQQLVRDNLADAMLQEYPILPLLGTEKLVLLSWIWFNVLIVGSK